MTESDSAVGAPADAASWEPAALTGKTWHGLERSAALALLASRDQGLTRAEAERRRGLVGRNLLPRARGPGPLLIYLHQFKNPLVYLLLAATLVSLLVGETTDAAFIFVVLQFNAVIGTYQEWRAEMAAEALDALIRSEVTLRRPAAKGEFRRERVEAAELVPGDLVELVSGDRVPADLRLLTDQDLRVDESLLTGESTLVTKRAEDVLAAETPLADRSNLLHAGSTLSAGRALGLVVATAGTTEIGRIAESLRGASASPPPLVLRLERFSRIVGIATLVMIAGIGAALFAQGAPLVTVFLVAVALAVAAIPEGLPIAITVALAIATSRMVRRNVIVRSLPAVEGLGACTLIASDKTGTLTQNRLSVERLFLAGGEGSPAWLDREGGWQVGDDREEALRLRRLAIAGVLCNEGSIERGDKEGDWVRVGDTVDTALLVMAAELGLEQESLRREHPLIGAIPYEPRNRYGAAFVTFVGPAPLAGGEALSPGRALVLVKGAAEAILPHCEDGAGGELAAEADRLAAEGYRVIAVAQGEVEASAVGHCTLEDLSGLELLGFLGLIDPLRPEVPAAIERCREAGIGVCMITGDHPGTALAIARHLGLAERHEEVVTGAELARAELAESEGEPAALAALLARAKVYARVDPTQKLSIVQGLQRRGEVVAVTGDGVNDAPALKAADLGVAMGLQGTDVARGAADLILTDDNFASIVAGVEEGRVAYDNVRKLIFLLIATGLGEIVLFLLSILAGLPLPLSAVQLLWLNLVTNGLQDIALAFEKGEPGVLKRRPRRPGERLFDRRMILQVCFSGGYIGVLAFGFFAWALEAGMAEAQARNLLLLLMVLLENAHALNARSETRSLAKIPLAANPFLLLAILGAQALHLSMLYWPWGGALLGTAPIGLDDWLLVAGLALSLILVVELAKAATRHTGPIHRCLSGF